MTRAFNLSGVCFICLFSACKSNSKSNLLPEIATCDSATIMYYHIPGEPRFFNMMKVREKNPLAIIANDVNGKTIAAKNNCITQGKIYFYGKGGAVYVVYFSRVKECMTLSFIKTGEKYYTKMSSGAKQLLDESEKRVTVLPGRAE